VKRLKDAAGEKTRDSWGVGSLTSAKVGVDQNALEEKEKGVKVSWKAKS